MNWLAETTETFCGLILSLSSGDLKSKIKVLAKSSLKVLGNDLLQAALLVSCSLRHSLACR